MIFLFSKYVFHLVTLYREYYIQYNYLFSYIYVYSVTYTDSDDNDCFLLFIFGFDRDSIVRVVKYLGN